VVGAVVGVGAMLEAGRLATGGESETLPTTENGERISNLLHNVAKLAMVVGSSVTGP